MVGHLCIQSFSGEFATTTASTTMTGSRCCAAMIGRAFPFFESSFSRDRSRRLGG